MWTDISQSLKSLKKSKTDINDDLPEKAKSENISTTGTKYELSKKENSNNKSKTDKNADLSKHDSRDDKSKKGESDKNSLEGENGSDDESDGSYNESLAGSSINESSTDNILNHFSSYFSSDDDDEKMTDTGTKIEIKKMEDSLRRFYEIPIETILEMFNKIVATACTGNNEDVDYLKLAGVLNGDTQTIDRLIINSPKWKLEESDNYCEHMLARAISLDYSSATMCIFTKLNKIELGALEFDELGHSSMQCIQKHVQTMDINMVLPDTKTDISELAFVWLFIWALFNGKFAVANKLRATCIKSKIASSLLACRCIDVVKATIHNKNQWKVYDYYLQKYTKRAINKLKQCYEVKPAMAKKMLVRKRDDFGGSSILQIAKTNKEFIEQPACQDTINDIWMGSIELERNPNWKIGLCLILPIIASILLRFQEDKANTKRNTHFLKAMAEKMYLFLNSPIVKFLYSTLSFIAFVLIFALYILFNVFDNYTFGDILLMVWVANILTEEIKQFIERAVYFRDPWTWMNITAIATFICGKSLQLTGFLDEGRILFAISFMTFTLKLLNVFSVLENIGPLLVMIGQMFKDLMRFLLILSVVYLSFAVTIQTVLYPVLTLNWPSIIALITRHYWNIFGDFSKTLEEFQGEQGCVDGEQGNENGRLTTSPTVAGTYIAPLLLAAFLLVVQILLLNLLIAMFSYSFNVIHRDAERHWCLLRFKLMIVYSCLPIIPPPFSLILNIYIIVVRLVRRCQGTGSTQIICKNLTDKENHKLHLFEINHSSNTDTGSKDSESGSNYSKDSGHHSINVKKMSEKIRENLNRM